MSSGKRLVYSCSSNIWEVCFRLLPFTLYVARNRAWSFKTPLTTGRWFLKKWGTQRDATGGAGRALQLWLSLELIILPPLRKHLPALSLQRLGEGWGSCSQPQSTLLVKKSDGILMALRAEVRSAAAAGATLQCRHHSSLETWGKGDTSSHCSGRAKL